MRSIELKKSDVLEFFGSTNAVAELLDINQASVSQWGEYVPEGKAWRLLHISKTPGFRRNKLIVEINV